MSKPLTVTFLGGDIHPFKQEYLRPREKFKTWKKLLSRGRRQMRYYERNKRGAHTYWYWLATHWYCSQYGCTDRGVSRLGYCTHHA